MMFVNATKFLGLLAVVWISYPQVYILPIENRSAPNLTNQILFFFSSFPSFQPTTAYPHECIEIYAQLCKLINIESFLKGPEETASAVNKALYSIFDDFVKVFGETLNKIDAKVHDGPADTKAVEKQQKLRQIANEVMVEFEARERRLYLEVVYYRRNTFTDNINFPENWALFQKIWKLIEIARDAPEKIRALRVLLKKLRMELLDICDHSLNGFRALIESYKVQTGHKKIPELDWGNLVAKEEGARYSVDERMDLSDHVEEVKDNIAIQYFNAEYAARVHEQKMQNLSSFVITLLGNITNNAVKTVDKLKQFEKEAKTRMPALVPKLK